MTLKSKAKEEKDEQAAAAEPSTKNSTAVAPTTQAAAPAIAGNVSAFITNPALLDAIVDATYRSFPSITASNGTHMSNGEDLGKVVKFQVLEARTNWKVAPGSNDEEAKDYFCVSDDGETINGTGKSIGDAVQEAIDAGYEKAAIKEYIDVYCLLTECEHDDFNGEIAVLQLSPSSQFTWKPLAGKMKMKAALGKLETEAVGGNPELGTAVVFKSTATPTTWKGNSFTKFEFSV